MKDWKNKELTTLLSEAWGFKFNTLQEFDEFNGTGEIQEEGGEELEELARATQAGDRNRPHKSKKYKDEVPPADEEDDTEDPLEESEDTGASEDDDSKTHPGEKDYTTKKGDKLKDTEDDGARGEKKGDEADINESEGKDELRETIKALLGKYIKG
jgi:Mg-chelatase subunit ChlI